MARQVQWTDDPATWKGELEGDCHGSGVSIIFARLEPGKPGPKLHKHPYAETFVVRRGMSWSCLPKRRIPSSILATTFWK
jgi:hypothetical protein